MKKLLFVLAFAFGGCAGGNTQPAALAPGSLPAIAMPARSSGKLIYVTNYASNSLTFYSYKTGKEEGSVTSGLSAPQGVCSDSKGNVFVANTDDVDVLEFSHGGTTSSQTISTSGMYPGGCTISSTKTLAVVGLCSYPNCSEGELLLYPHENGSPATVTCPNLYRYYFATYDGSGNLFAVGNNISGDFEFCEVPHGTTQGIAITLDSPPSVPSPLQWDGKYIATMYADGDVIGRYAISGTSGTLEGTVTLSGAQEYFTIASRKAVVAETASGYGFWKYPTGGNPYKTQQLTNDGFGGMAISPAPSF